MALARWVQRRVGRGRWLTPTFDTPVMTPWRPSRALYDSFAPAADPKTPP